MEPGQWWVVAGGVLLAEGLMPLLAPRAWRDAMRRLMALRDGQLRFLGLAAVTVGILMLCT
jgi:uncharacterized protein YjeT (DUF2065 family)